jgi:uncharacterized membrane protein
VTRRTAVMAALAAIGLVVAAYLTTVHYAGTAPVCALSGSCEKVQSSSYAELAGVPVALIGLLGYAAILVSLAVARGEDGRLARVAMTAVGFGFSVYLTYVELFVIDAICQWCVASAVLMTALFAIAVGDFLYPRSSRYSSLAETPVSSATTAAAGRTRAPASTKR